MLSGTGPREELTNQAWYKVRVDLPGVDTNLQDRYEAGVVNRSNSAREEENLARRTNAIPAFFISQVFV